MRPASAIVSPPLIVFCGGVNLILLQWMLARELTALLLGTELVVLLVSAAYFTGLSVGYALAGRVKSGWLAPLGALALATHLSLPVWFRLLVAALDSLGAYALAFAVLPLLVAFIAPAFYSVFLPLFADSGQARLPTLYALEVAGAVCGALALAALGGLGLQALMLLYTAGLLAVLLALRVRPARVLALAAGAGLWLLALPAANIWSNSLWYQTLMGLPAGTTTLYTAYSPYQKIDVLQAPGGGRFLYLDGLNHFDAYDGQRLNVVMGLVPGLLIRPANALVIGAGSMQMEAMIADFAGHVTTVEIDPLVVEASTRYFAATNRLDSLTNRSIVVDDAKHFLANTGERYDLIATDLPAAYSIQTAALYSEGFYGAAAARLNPGGVLVANLTDAFSPDSTVSRRIVAGLLAHFDQVLVVTPESVGWSFAYAGDDLPFDRGALEDALRQTGETRFRLYDLAAVRAIVGDARPITLDTLDVALAVSVEWIRQRWGE